MVVTGAPRKRLVLQGARGFESHPLRHLHSLTLVRWRFGCASGFDRRAPRVALGTNPTALRRYPALVVLGERLDDRLGVLVEHEVAAAARDRSSVYPRHSSSHRVRAVWALLEVGAQPVAPIGIDIRRRVVDERNLLDAEVFARVS